MKKNPKKPTPGGSADLVTVSVKMPRDLLELLDQHVRHKDTDRSKTLRHGIRHVLGLAS